MTLIVGYVSIFHSYKAKSSIEIDRFPSKLRLLFHIFFKFRIKFRALTRNPLTVCVSNRSEGGMRF